MQYLSGRGDPRNKLIYILLFCFPFTQCQQNYRGNLLSARVVSVSTLEPSSRFSLDTHTQCQPLTYAYKLNLTCGQVYRPFEWDECVREWDLRGCGKKSWVSDICNSKIYLFCGQLTGKGSNIDTVRGWGCISYNTPCSSVSIPDSALSGSFKSFHLCPSHLFHFILLLLLLILPQGFLPLSHTNQSYPIFYNFTIVAQLSIM